MKRLLALFLSLVLMLCAAVPAYATGDGNFDGGGGGMGSGEQREEIFAVFFRLPSIPSECGVLSGLKRRYQSKLLS